MGICGIHEEMSRVLLKNISPLTDHLCVSLALFIWVGLTTASTFSGSIMKDYRGLVAGGSRDLHASTARAAVFAATPCAPGLSDYCRV